MKGFFKRIAFVFILQVALIFCASCAILTESHSSGVGDSSHSSTTEDESSVSESTSSESSSSSDSSTMDSPTSSLDKDSSTSSDKDSSTSSTEGSTGNSATDTTDSSDTTTDSTDNTTASTDSITDSSVIQPPVDDTPDDTPDECVEHDYVLTNIYNNTHHYFECSVCGERMKAAHEFDSFAVSAAEVQTDYIAGESFNCDGLQVYTECECGQIQAINDYQILYPTAGQTQLVLGDGYVTVAFGGNQTPINITVHKFEGIRITTQPTDTTYEEGETFQKYGMVVCAYCNCGYERELSTYTVAYPAAGQKSFRLGDTYVTITYGEWSIRLSVTVKKYGGGNWSGMVPF